MSRSTHSQTKSVSGSTALDDAKALAKKVTTLVGAPAALTKADIQRSTKLKKGGATVVRTIAALSDQFGLSVQQHPTAAMVEKITKAESLVALHKQLVAVTKQVSDAMFLAQSESWASATAHYSMLRRLAQTDGNVAKTLQPVKQFFAARSASVETAEKAKRGGARKGSKKSQTSEAPAADAKVPANSESQAPETPEAPPAPQSAETPSTPSPAPQANGAAH